MKAKIIRKKEGFSEKLDILVGKTFNVLKVDFSYCLLETSSDSNRHRLAVGSLHHTDNTIIRFIRIAS